jgi:cell division septum initiation protein DivIVA
LPLSAWSNKEAKKMGMLAENTLKTLRDGIESETKKLASLDATRRQLTDHAEALKAERDQIIAETQAAQQRLAGVRDQQREADDTAKRMIAAAQAEASSILAAANKEVRKLLADARKHASTSTEVGELIANARVTLARAQNALDGEKP